MGGGANPLVVTEKGVFFSEKEKNMQNVLKWKNKQNYFVTFLQGYPLKTISRYFHKILKVFFLRTSFISFMKTYGGGGAQNVTE